MTVQLSVTVRNAMLDAIESGAQVGQTTGIGTAPVLRLWAGTKRTDCSTADDATATNKLAEFTLSSDWASNASAGTKTFLGSPVATDSSADNTGTLTYYRLYNSAGTTCHMQGTITPTAGGGDMTVDSTSVTAGQAINITGWSINMAGHA